MSNQEAFGSPLSPPENILPQGRIFYFRNSDGRKGQAFRMAVPEGKTGTPATGFRGFFSPEIAKSYPDVLIGVLSAFKIPLWALLKYFLSFYKIKCTGNLLHEAKGTVTIVR